MLELEDGSATSDLDFCAEYGQTFSLADVAVNKSDVSSRIQMFDDLSCFISQDVIVRRPYVPIAFDLRPIDLSPNE